MPHAAMSPEFDLIARYFTRAAPQAVLGVGDDAALLAPSPDMELAISTDMLVAGTHFFHDADPHKLGWKTLAVNISDIAAMGAHPRWATLALALPQVDEHWLKAFSQGFFECADHFGVDLVGGDTTRGPLTLCVQIMGEVPAGQALRRDRAKVGDDIWVSGTLGGAALGLAALQQRMQLDGIDLLHCLRALETPQPRVALGLALRSIAHAAIDISDGLLADLGHILQASHVGAEIRLADIPCTTAIKHHLHHASVQRMVLSGGDDYELCFTAPVNQRATIQHLQGALDLQMGLIGKVTAASGCLVTGLDGRLLNIEKPGFDHFSA